MLNFLFTFGAPFRKNEVRFDIILRAKIEPLGGKNVDIRSGKVLSLIQGKKKISELVIVCTPKY
jgi:hypothetical protein